jgi:quercetin dioxygenase-like cupin family protein
MNIRLRWLTGITLALGCAAVAVFATPSAGLIFTNYLGFTDRTVHANVDVALPAPVNGEDDWDVSFHTSGPSNFIFQDLTITPGGYTGWHTHPGIILTTVVSGSIEWYDGKCRKHVYNAGDSLTESDKLHYVRNAGIDNARLMIAFVIAKGQPRKIDQAAPSCAATIGLL